MMHVADHHVVPGKKQWTWGNGDFGRAWDRQLTDEDGPYVELMCGAYTDNQPDFSWLMPGEEKRFTQRFLPYKEIGGAKNASSECVLNLEVDGERAEVGVYVTRPRAVEVRLLRRGELLQAWMQDLAPETAFSRVVPLPAGVAAQELTLRVESEGERLLEYTPLPESRPEIPAPAAAARPPEEIGSVEELFLNGLHLEQYRHATYAPEPYYEEALRRDPGDSRCNNALGLLLYRRGKFADAEPYFRRAVERLTLRNPNPYDGEPYYNLGLSLKMQGRYEEAFDAFYKAVWNDAWQMAGYFELARLACRRGDLEEALELVDHSLARNDRHHRARHLKIALLSRLGHEPEADTAIREALERDPIELGALYERRLLHAESEFERLARGWVHNYLELALDYAHAGLLAEAVRVLDEAPPADPMVRYYQAWFELQRGDEAAARARAAEAARMSPDYCFPHRIECVPALRAAQELDPDDARAPYYLGNFWYAHRRHEEAVEAWERARDLDPSFPTVHRNLGLA
jgi:tetratricopeptide (TPR) repeat protein